MEEVDVRQKNVVCRHMLLEPEDGKVFRVPREVVDIKGEIERTLVPTQTQDTLQIRFVEPGTKAEKARLAGA